MRRLDLLDELVKEGVAVLRRAEDAANGYPKARAKIEAWISGRPEGEQDMLRRALLASNSGTEAVQ
jgi:hypothetical protein